MKTTTSKTSITSPLLEIINRRLGIGKKYGGLKENAMFILKNEDREEEDNSSSNNVSPFFSLLWHNC